MDTYQVGQLKDAPQITVTVPGSKSITNRALLMAAMAEGDTTLSGVLFSDDSRVFVKALQDLGFQVQVEEKEKRIRIQGMGGVIPKRRAEIYVGSAGTAARFLTAFVAMADGIYRLDSSEQMKKRPMNELVEALRRLGAGIDCLEEEGTFPMEITGVGCWREEKEGQKRLPAASIDLNIDRSSQFLSALLMTAPLRFRSVTVSLTGTRSARSYVEMTEQMMKQFSHPGVVRLAEDCYRVDGAGYVSQDYQIEPDISAACYFYAMAAITGGTAHVRHVRKDSLQGDMKFLQVLEQMGCVLDWQDGQLFLKGPKPGCLRGIDADFSDFSDQTLTLAAIAPYANSPVKVRNVGHIRGQECDRLHAICTNLEKMKVRCEEREDGFVVYPSRPQPAVVDTFQDHRVAMAFAVTGIGTPGIEIANPSCCRKTFEEYFQVLDQVLLENKV